jgi:hypothetical protein
MGDSGLTWSEGVVSWTQAIFCSARAAAIEMDLVGLLLLGLAFSPILLPLNLAPSSANGGRNNPRMITMLVVGFVILMMFIAYEAHHPTTAFWKPRLLGCSDGKFVQPNAISYAQRLLLLVRQHHQAMVQLRQDSFHSHNHFVTRFMSPIGGLIHRPAHH